MISDPVLNVDEVVYALKLSRATIYKLVKSHRLKSFTIGSRRLFRFSDLEAFVNDLTPTTPGDGEYPVR